MSDVSKTEVIDATAKGMDLWSTQKLAAYLCNAHFAALGGKITNVSQQVAIAGEAITKCLLGTTGRLVYCGAGSAGAQACIDGLELPGTFGWPKERLVLLLAGGWDSFFNQGPIAEDDKNEAVKAIVALELTENDVFIAVSASGSTPYTLTALEHAKSFGALTISISNNRDSQLAKKADMSILLETGSEAVAGSTRLAAGTAQKIALNSLSTLVMSKLGYLYDNLMVRMVVSNQKLIRRATQIVVQICQCDENKALKCLEIASYQIPEAVLIQHGMNLSDARDCLEKHQYNLRTALSRCA